MPMNINPMQLIQMIKGGQNPQQLVMNMLEQQMQNTPMGANLLSLAKQNRSADIEQAIYYCTVTKAMKEKSDDEEPQRMYYKESIRKKKRNVPMDYYDRYEDEDEREYPIKIYDSREGKSPERRRMYMESKELHHDQAKKLKELEEYMQELNADILEMIEGASQEEKQLLQKKIALLATKINV